MNDIKIVFFDIDGTLLKFGNRELSPNTLKALKGLKEKGIILCIATGRSPLNLPKFKGINFDCFMTFNGSYCFNDKGDIFSNPIDNNEIDIVINNAKEINKPVSIATKNHIICNGQDKDLIEYFSFAHVPLVISDEFDKVVKDDVYQLMISATKNEYDTLIKNTKHIKIAAWWDKAVDIIPKNGGKGIGVNKILEYYHLNSNEAIAFGDGDNDIEMLKEVGLGIAMGNASDNLKKVANEVCDNVDNDGVYHYCIDKGLI